MKDPDFTVNAGFVEIIVRKKTRRVPLATADQVAYVEQKVHSLCDFHASRIERMSAKRLFCFISQRLTAMDFERGIMAGQIPDRAFHHTPEFLKWEENLFDRALERQKIVGDWNPDPKPAVD